MTRALRLGTRGSHLALAQSGHVADALRAHGHDVELVVVKTRGDVERDLSLQANVDKGFFTAELEAALADGSLDLVVHSLKDLPTESPANLVIGATPPRAPVVDVLLARPEVVADRPGRLPLRAGARIGTSAARRTALLAVGAPDAAVVPLRGNVPTRLAAAAQGRLDAVLLARAGLARLGLVPGDLVAFDLVPTAFIPAPGQGALAVQCRADRNDVRAALAAIHDADSAADVEVERDVLRRFEGGCHAAVGAHVDRDAGVLVAGALVDGRWRAARVPLGPDAAARAVDAVLAAPSFEAPDRWAVPAARWW